MMGKIAPGVLKDFQDGTYVHDVDFDKTFEIIRTAINDNYDGLVNRYTKAEVDSLLTSVGAGVAISVQVLNVLPTGVGQGRFVLKNPENILYYYTGSSWIQLTVAGDLSTVQTSLTNHINNVSNPHAVTASQVGAVPIGQRGAANGVATLDANGQVTLAQRTPFEIMFGNAIDGDATISGTVTLSRNMYYNNLTINAGATLKSGGYKIFVKGTLLNNGKIDSDGLNGGAGTASTVTYGGAGGSGGGGNGGDSGSSGGTGGGGGGSNAGGSGGKGGDGTSSSMYLGGSAGAVTGVNLATLLTLELLEALYNFNASGGGGGGGGSSYGTGATNAGSGGGGGGKIQIYAKTITNNGTISANGGNGGSSYVSNAGAGGGGGGGSILTCYQTYTGSAPTANAGTAGTGGINSVAANGQAGFIKSVKVV